MLQAALVGAPPMQKFHRTEWRNPVTGGIYKTKDDRHILLLELNPGNFNNLIDALALNHLKSDERFATPGQRASNHQDLFDEIQNVFASFGVEEMRERLKNFGVNFSVVQTTHECIRDEHMLANGCFPAVEGTDGITTIDSPIHILAEGVEKTKPRIPPNIGEHTMSELIALGLSEGDVRMMAKTGAIGLPR